MRLTNPLIMSKVTITCPVTNLTKTFTSANPTKAVIHDLKTLRRLQDNKGINKNLTKKLEAWQHVPIESLVINITQTFNVE
jgi:hypothetical protein